MILARIATVCTLALASTVGLQAQSPNQMTQDQLTRLIQNGRTLQLGGPGEGYTGELRLNANGTGSGRAMTDGGDRLTLKGRWEIRDGQFCRRWQEFDGGNEVCETWILRTPTSVDVFVGGTKVGVNAW